MRDNLHRLQGVHWPSSFVPNTHPSNSDLDTMDDLFKQQQSMQTAWIAHDPGFRSGRPLLDRGLLHGSISPGGEYIVFVYGPEPMTGPQHPWRRFEIIRAGPVCGSWLLDDPVATGSLLHDSTFAFVWRMGRESKGVVVFQYQRKR